MKSIIVVASLALLACVGCARLPRGPVYSGRGAASYGTRGGYVAPTGMGYGYGPAIVPPYVLPPGSSESFGTIYDPGTHPALYAQSDVTGSVRVIGAPPPPRTECEVPPCGSEPEVTAEDLAAVVDVLDETRAEVHALRGRLDAPPPDSP